MLRQIEQKAIRKFNNMDYNLFQLADKTEVLYPGKELVNDGKDLRDLTKNSSNKDEESNSPHFLVE
jgi:hypothetical protein